MLHMQDVYAGKRWSGALCLFNEILVHEVREVRVSRQWRLHGWFGAAVEVLRDTLRTKKGLLLDWRRKTSL